MTENNDSGQNIAGPRVLLGTTMMFIYTLLIMGNIVTTTGSGLDCPDWPLCHGTVNPPKRIGVWIEWSHRLMGGITGTLIIFSAIYMFKRASGAILFFMKLVIGLVVTVVTLGGVIVITEAPFLDTATRIAIVSSHIIIAILIFTSMILTFRATFPTGELNDKKYTLIIYGIVFFQVILGIIVRYGNASLACPDWPLCRGSIMPPSMEGTVLLQYFHRLTAYTIFGITLWRLLKAVKSGADDIAKHAITFGLVLTQATIGIFIVLTKLFLPLLVLHGAVGFGLLGWLTFNSGQYLISPVAGVKEKEA